MTYLIPLRLLNWRTKEVEQKEAEIANILNIRGSISETQAGGLPGA